MDCRYCYTILMTTLITDKSLNRSANDLLLLLPHSTLFVGNILNNGVSPKVSSTAYKNLKVLENIFDFEEGKNSLRKGDYAVSKNTRRNKHRNAEGQEQDEEHVTREHYMKMKLVVRTITRAPIGDTDCFNQGLAAGSENLKS